MSHGPSTLVVTLALILAACSGGGKHEPQSPSKMSPASGTRNGIDRDYAPPGTETTETGSADSESDSSNLYDPKPTTLGLGPGFAGSADAGPQTPADGGPSDDSPAP